VPPRFGMVESDLFEGTGAVDSWYGDRSQSTLWQESGRGGGSTSSNHAPPRDRRAGTRAATPNLPPEALVSAKFGFFITERNPANRFECSIESAP
jgi:hypothetical protein